MRNITKDVMILIFKEFTRNPNHMASVYVIYKIQVLKRNMPKHRHKKNSGCQGLRGMEEYELLFNGF